MTDLELYIKAFRPDLVSISVNPDSSYTIGQVELFDEEGNSLGLQDLPNLAEIESLADSYLAYQSEYNLKRIVEGALGKGQALIQEFITENLVLGITQAGKTKEVRQAMAEVTSCLMTGSLYDAIDELRLIPTEAKDATFITDVRILSYINKIESYLGLELSTEI